MTWIGIKIVNSWLDNHSSLFSYSFPFISIFLSFQFFPFIPIRFLRKICTLVCIHLHSIPFPQCFHYSFRKFVYYESYSCFSSFLHFILLFFSLVSFSSQKDETIGSNKTGANTNMGTIFYLHSQFTPSHPFLNNVWEDTQQGWLKLGCDLSWEPKLCCLRIWWDYCYSSSSTQSSFSSSVVYEQRRYVWSSSKAIFALGRVFFPFSWIKDSERQMMKTNKYAGEQKRMREEEEERERKKSWRVVRLPPHFLGKNIFRLDSLLTWFTFQILTTAFLPSSVIHQIKLRSMSCLPPWTDLTVNKILITEKEEKQKRGTRKCKQKNGKNKIVRK